jgi:hypothetical protein
MPGRATARRSWFTFALTVLVALQSATPACARSRLGHRGISRLAEKRLTPAARAAIATSHNTELIRNRYRFMVRTSQSHEAGSSIHSVRNPG